MRPVRIVFVCIAAAVLAASAFVIAAGGVAAETALHPLRRKAASNCPLIQNAAGGTVSTTAADAVALKAWYFQPLSGWNGAAVMVLHGVGDWRGSMTGFASMLVQHGFAVLAPDLRGHGESGGMCTYGVCEVEDVRAWTTWLRQTEGIERIYGLGESLGAAVLISALPEEPRLRSIVAECAYTSFCDIARERVRRVTPLWVHPALEPFLAAGISCTRIRHAVDLGHASPLEALRRTSRPVLLIHGLEDNETSPENSVRLAKANPCVTELWLVPGAGHTMAWSAAGAEFERRVTEWFLKH